MSFDVRSVRGGAPDLEPLRRGDDLRFVLTAECGRPAEAEPSRDKDNVTVAWGWVKPARLQLIRSSQGKSHGVIRN